MNKVQKKINGISYIAIALLVLVVFSATYAYFGYFKDVESDVSVNANVIPGSYSFMVSTSGDIGFSIIPEMMSQDSVGDVVVSDTQTLSINLDSPTENVQATCTYDIIWQWSSEDKYTFHTNGNNEKEFTVSITGGVDETNLTDFPITNNDVNKIVLLKDAQITSYGLPSVINHNVSVKIYNVDAEQTAALVGSSGKRLAANIKVDENSIDCLMTRLTGKGVSLGMIKNNESSSYQNGDIYFEEDSFGYNLLKDDATTFSGGSGLVKDILYGNMFRYQSSSDNVNNYVCFGYANVTDCTGSNKENYLYRIIGIDNDTKEVQLIKAVGVKVGSTKKFAYHSSQTNTDWGPNMTYTQADISMRLNGTHTSLSNIFVNSTEYPYMSEGSSWYNKISDHAWKSGIKSSIGSYDGITAYNNESNLTLTSPMKIGLISESDVYYAYTGGNPVDRDTNKNNWLYTDVNSANGFEWAINRSDNKNASGLLGNGTRAGSYSNNTVTYTWRVRPSFYLISSISLVGGTGSILDPFIVS